MNEMDFENRLQSLAKGMEYPRTPDIAGSVMPRLHPPAHPRFITKSWAWSLTIVIVLLSSLMLIPPARAAIIEFIQIGIVRIFPRTTGPTVEAPHTATPESIAPLTATPDLIPILNQIAGETTLAEAQKVVDYEILIPTHPLELGQPDRIYVQDANGAMTILVWLDHLQPNKIKMSLHFIPAGSWAIDKGFPADVVDTSVNGRRAFWGEGPYPLRLYNGDLEFKRLIEGRVLIWAEGDLTFRLETDLSLEEAVKTAESLEPIR